MVEDNEGDIILAKEAFIQAKVWNHISVAKDGEEAIDFLFRKGKFSNALIPDLILLDINIPKINGLQVLKIIKADPQISGIPVVMLTSSAAERDISEAYSNYVNFYMTKPVGFEKILDVINNIENFWLSIVKLPDIEKV
ncbi:MAG: response regulator [Chitinophagaceae bacterium]